MAPAPALGRDGARDLRDDRSGGQERELNLAAFSSALRTTFVGSMTPPFDQVAVLEVWRCRSFTSFAPGPCPPPIAPSTPEFQAICLIGASTARRMMSIPVFSSAVAAT